MERMRPPHVPEVPVPVPTDAEMARLLKATNGQDFQSVRDHALLAVFLDCGCRLAEIAGLSVGDIDFDNALISVLGKGGKPRYLPFSRKCALALDRYLRACSRRPDAREPGLWLGTQGPMTGNGIAQVVRRLADEAGIEGLHPHTFRHWWAHQLRLAGGDDDSLMRLAGWSARSMLNRYGASAADVRARATHSRLSPFDHMAG